MVDEVKRTIRRTRQYWFVDGLAEMSAGLLFLVLGLIFFGQAHVPGRTAAGLVLRLAFPAVVLSGFWLCKQFVQGLKERITYPRTGYVSYPKTPRGVRRIAIVGSAVLAAFIAQLWVRYHPVPLDWTPLVEGVMTAILLVIAGQGLRRFWWIGGFALLCGFTLAVLRLPGPDILASAYFYSITGLFILISGTVTLWKYLRISRVEDNQ